MTAVVRNNAGGTHSNATWNYYYYFYYSAVNGFPFGEDAMTCFSTTLSAVDPELASEAMVGYQVNKDPSGSPFGAGLRIVAWRRLSRVPSAPTWLPVLPPWPTPVCGRWLHGG